MAQAHFHIVGSIQFDVCLDCTEDMLKVVWVHLIRESVQVGTKLALLVAQHFAPAFREPNLAGFDVPIPDAVACPLDR